MSSVVVAWLGLFALLGVLKNIIIEVDVFETIEF